MPDDQSFSRKDDIGKISLAKQIDRTAMLLSEKLDAGATDIMRAQKILVTAKLNAVDTLAYMIKKYLKDYGKWDELKGFDGKLKLLNSESDGNATLKKENLAEEKFGFLMEFIAMKGWFIEDSSEETIGAPE
jgi:hypothetical protein